VDGYVVEPSDFQPLDLAMGAAAAAQEMGSALVVVSNQGAIGRGHATESQIMVINALLLEMLARREIVLDGIYLCPHHPLSADPMHRNCECRKPKPGLILAAARDLNLDVDGSILIGDQESDLAAARAAGISEDRALLIGPATRTDPALFVRRALRT
jgi:D-glycero-D-manno-heptose 1,7-bisphosphate phosphatase